MAFEIGVSSACFYPLETEKSLELAGSYGFKNVELFLNSPSELSDDFVGKLIDIRNRYGIHIVSVHPFFSFAESFFLFSDYARRFEDILPLYDRFFKVTSMLGADIFVIHGMKKISSASAVNNDEYCRRFKRLIDMGKAYGVKVCHENVVDHRCESPEYMEMMRENIGDDFRIVLDIKQARRAGFTPYDFLEPLHDSIVHIHISDRNDRCDCITPLKGNFDFAEFFSTAKSYGYNGKFIIELYEWSYKDKEEIAEAYKKLINIAESCC